MGRKADSAHILSKDLKQTVVNMRKGIRAKIFITLKSESRLNPSRIFAGIRAKIFSKQFNPASKPHRCVRFNRMWVIRDRREPGLGAGPRSRASEPGHPSESSEPSLGCPPPPPL